MQPVALSFLSEDQPSSESAVAADDSASTAGSKGSKKGNKMLCGVCQKSCAKKGSAAYGSCCRKDVEACRKDQKNTNIHHHQENHIKIYKKNVPEMDQTYTQI